MRIDSAKFTINHTEIDTVQWGNRCKLPGISDAVYVSHSLIFDYFRILGLNDDRGRNFRARISSHFQFEERAVFLLSELRVDGSRSASKHLPALVKA